MPAQRPGKSKQDVQTPADFIGAVVERFGPLAIDLAANADNHIAVPWFGPGAKTLWMDSFAVDWHMYKGLLWLNPPFGQIKLWVSKCAHEWIEGARIALLVPAAVGSNWFAKYVDGKARVFLLRPRLTFVGHEHPYPKDLMLCVYGLPPGTETWKWK